MTLTFEIELDCEPEDFAGVENFFAWGVLSEFVSVAIETKG